MIRTTVEALGGAQAVPSELIPARELHQHLQHCFMSILRDDLHHVGEVSVSALI